MNGFFFSSSVCFLSPFFFIRIFFFILLLCECGVSAAMLLVDVDVDDDDDPSGFFRTGFVEEVKNCVCVVVK
jgi:hypothetical protein